MKYGYKLLQNNSNMAVEEGRGKGYMPPQYDPTTHDKRGHYPHKSCKLVE